jgi:large subunit ribosomal protein L2
LPNNLKIFNILHGFDFRLMFENVYIGMWSHLNLFPINSYLYNVELKSFQGGKLARAAGSWVRLIGKNDTKAVIKMKSGLKMILSNTVFGSFGVVSRLHWKLHKFKNAGEKRNLGFKPKVRGVAMNPCDHPHGGGEGKKSKKVTPRTPWGKFTMNTKTKTSLRALKKKSKLKKIEYYL